MVKLHSRGARGVFVVYAVNDKEVRGSASAPSSPLWLHSNASHFWNSGRPIEGAETRTEGRLRRFTYMSTPRTHTYSKVLLST